LKVRGTSGLHRSFIDLAAVEGSEEKRLGASRKVRDELGCNAFGLANVVYPGQRMLPARVRSFIDFAVTYRASVLNPKAGG
jgi:hypothetical protein